MRLAFSLVYRFVWDSISGYTFANLKLATITLTLVSSRSPKPSVQNFWSSRLTAHSFSQPLENEPIMITRMSQRRLPMKTRQTNSEAKHQRTYSIRSRICKSTSGRISFELFHPCLGTHFGAKALGCPGGRGGGMVTGQIDTCIIISASIKEKLF